MKLSTRARYALRMMADIAGHGGEAVPVSLAAVSARSEISRGYLEQLALALRSAELVTSVAGRRGGYLLARPATEITLAQVVEATIGPISVVGCVKSPERCHRAESCGTRRVYQLINRRITDVLEELTVADLATPGDPLTTL